MLKPQLAMSRRSVESVEASILYLLLSFGFFGLGVLRNASTIYVGAGQDPSAYMWSLVWWPYAITRDLNPFITRVIWAPAGCNLTSAAAIPGPSLAVWPITHAFGPVVAYNILILLAPVSAAWATFSLCRHISGQFWPSILGGYIFGFSSYMLGQMLAHLNLALIFAVPLSLYILLLRLDNAISRARFMTGFSALLAFQFLTSTELFATMTLFGATALIAACVLLPKDDRTLIRSALPSIAFAYGACAVFLAPYLYYAIGHGEPSAFHPVEQCSADLAGFFVPTPITLIGGAHLASLAKSLTPDMWYSEKGAYLGPGLLIVFLAFVFIWWRRPIGKFLICGIILICVSSLGPRLHVLGQAYFLLPWRLLLRFPLIDQALPIRLTVYLWLVAAIVTSLTLSSSEIPRFVRVTISCLSVLFMLPNLHYFRLAVTKVDTPDFFSKGTFKQYFAENDTLLIFPFGSHGNSMLWQAQTNMYFRMAGGYIGPQKPKEYRRWPVVTALQEDRKDPSISAQLRPFLISHDAKGIVVARPDREKWRAVLVKLGVEPIQVDDVLVYKLR